VQSSVAEINVFLSSIVHDFVDDKSVQSTESLGNVKKLCFSYKRKLKVRKNRSHFLVIGT
jgi:hypothetical protein